MIRRWIGLLFSVIMLCVFAGCSEEDTPDGLYAVIETSRGTVVCRLEFEKVPLTVANFVGLSEGTIESNRGKDAHFYDGLVFHRVITSPQPFMVQGGCPNGNGTGDPGYKFSDEFHPDLKHSGPGILSMANSGPDSNGSQFFITLAATPWLDGKHSVFGHVVTGMDVVQMVKQGDAIKSITIKRVGKKAGEFKSDGAAFGKLKEAALAQKAKREKSAAGKQEEDIKAKWPGAVTSESGLKHLVGRPGSGPSPKRGEAVTVHYVGALLNGQVFDNSRGRGQPFVFPVGMGKVIKGWDEAVLQMKKGEQRTVIVPPALGYGGMDMRDRQGRIVIPANSWLVFDIELIEIGEPPRKQGDH